MAQGRKGRPTPDTSDLGPQPYDRTEDRLERRARVEDRLRYEPRAERACWLLACLALRRNYAELLHHSHYVLVTPVLHCLPVGPPGDIDPRDRYYLSSGRYTHEGSFVRAVPGDPRHHLVPFGYLILDGVVEVRKGRAERRDKQLDPIQARRHPGHRA